MKARSSRAALIIRSTRELAEPVRVTGATQAALALLVARYRLRVRGHVVVLCPNDDAASEFASDLETLSALIDRNPLLVCHFPTWEQSPYSPIAPSLRTRLARVAVLGHFCRKIPPAGPSPDHDDCGIVSGHDSPRALRTPHDCARKRHERRLARSPGHAIDRSRVISGSIRSRTRNLRCSR